MNEWIRRLINQAKSLWGKWSRTQKIILFSVVGVSVLAIILLVVFSSQPSMVPLIGRPITDDELLFRIITRLDEEIPDQYQVREDNQIFVSDRATARRMLAILVREDLIPTETDHDVDAAQIIIDIPEDSLFTEDQKPITTSIQLTPKPGSDLRENRKVIEGIVKLVKLAIAGLEEDNIVITDQFGIQLNDFVGLAEVDRLELAKRELQLKSRLEQDYKREILNALREFFTDDRIEFLKLDIDLDMSKESSNTKEFFPITLTSDNPRTPFDESEVVVSTPISSEEKQRDWEGTGVNPEGPPGQEGQTPPDYKDLSNFVGRLSESSTIKNEAINEKNTEREERPWKIQRITAALAIDGVWRWKYDEDGNVLFQTDGSIDREYIPVTDAEISTVEALVKDSVGFDQARGDSVTVRHLQKDRREDHREEDDRFRRRRQVRDIVIWSFAGVGFILLAILLIRMLTKYLERKRREKEEELARQHAAMREAALRSAEEGGGGIELSVEERARLEMQENAVNMAREHPEDVAQLIRTWLMEE
jgi:flagellar M-ring protein FliF